MSFFGCAIAGRLLRLDICVSLSAGAAKPNDLAITIEYESEVISLGERGNEVVSSLRRLARAERNAEVSRKRHPVELKPYIGPEAVNYCLQFLQCFSGHAPMTWGAPPLRVKTAPNSTAPLTLAPKPTSASASR